MLWLSLKINFQVTFGNGLIQFEDISTLFKNDFDLSVFLLWPQHPCFYFAFSLHKFNTCFFDQKANLPNLFLVEVNLAEQDRYSCELVSLKVH